MCASCRLETIVLLQQYKITGPCVSVPRELEHNDNIVTIVQPVILEMHGLSLLRLSEKKCVMFSVV